MAHLVQKVFFNVQLKKNTNRRVRALFQIRTQLFIIEFILLSSYTLYVKLMGIWEFSSFKKTCSVVATNIIIIFFFGVTYCNNRKWNIRYAKEQTKIHSIGTKHFLYFATKMF